ncbi:phage tail tube protein [Salinicola salarius]|uniref:phage tail tube protein n=1 Tax=Salinicola salarius TaxID=430457 RepID=UPI000DA1187D|nr:phage tail tube protein [Salinicola salarius]
MKTRKKLLLAAPEATYGAGAEIADAVLIVVSELDSSPYEGDTVTRDRLRQNFGAVAQANAAPYTTVTATVPAAGSGVPGTPPAYGLLLRACSMSETIEAGVSVTYQPVTDDAESVCVWFVEDGQLQKVPGVRGTVEWSFTAKQFPTMSFTFTGFYSRPEALTEAINKQPANVVDEVVVNKQNTPGRSVHGYEGCLQSLSLNIGNTINYRALIGCESVQVTDRESTGSVEIEAPNIATKNYFEAIESHKTITLEPVSLTHGTVAGNIIKVDAPKVQLATISRSDSDGIVHYSMDMRLNPDQGDDEFTITYT